MEFLSKLFVNHGASLFLGVNETMCIWLSLMFILFSGVSQYYPISPQIQEHASPKSRTHLPSKRIYLQLLSFDILQLCHLYPVPGHCWWAGSHPLWGSFLVEVILTVSHPSYWRSGRWRAEKSAISTETIRICNKWVRRSSTPEVVHWGQRSAVCRRPKIINYFC